MEATTVRAVLAGLGLARRGYRAAELGGRRCFLLLGVDFHLDPAGRPWLLEAPLLCAHGP